MNPSNVLEFGVPLEGYNSQLNFTHYREIVESERTVLLDYPDFTGVAINLTNTIEYVLEGERFQFTKNHYEVVHTQKGRCEITLRPGLYTVILIKFPPEILNGADDKSIFHELLSVIRNNRRYQLNRPLQLPYQVHGIVDQMYRYKQSDKQETFIRIKVTEMIILFIDQITQPNKRSRIDDKFFAAIEQARLTMLADIQKEWTLNALADEANLSRRKLLTGFRKYFDTSPIHALYEERLDCAMALLRDTNLSVNEITARVGYKHSQNFSQAFSRKFGHPPTSYRPL
jgi:AraC-like DNA-binding protein